MHVSEVTRAKKLNSWWVWSDTHFGHQNIIKFQQRPVNHEVIMLSNWITRVREDDVILHLGDVFMGKGGNGKRWASVVRRMPGRKLMMLGNHDGAGVPMYESAGFEVVDPFIADVLGYRVAFTHRPITPAFPGHPEDDPFGVRTANLLLDDWTVNVHGHIHGNTIDRNHHFGEGDPIEDKRYVNVSVEAIDFSPRQIGSLV